MCWRRGEGVRRRRRFRHARGHARRPRRVGRRDGREGRQKVQDLLRHVIADSHGKGWH